MYNVLGTSAIEAEAGASVDAEDDYNNTITISLYTIIYMITFDGQGQDLESTSWSGDSKVIKHIQSYYIYDCVILQ